VTSSRSSRRVAVPIADLWRAMQRHAGEQDAYSAAATGLVADLEAAGFDVERLRGLRRSSVGDRRALPILLKWFTEVDFVPLKCDIAFVLGSRWAQPEGTEALIAEYSAIDDDAGRSADRVRAAICTSLERVADDSTFEDVRRIAVDSTHGSARGMAVVALGNVREHRARAIDALVELLDDDHVVLFAVLGLEKLDGREAIRDVALRTAHRNPVVRHVARRVVKRWTSATC
jgi:HEAT repeats